jgi:hypothetical protein
MKKTLTIILSALLLMAALCGCTQISSSSDATETDAVTETTPVPEPNPPSDFEYEANDEGNVVIKRYIGETVDVVIPSNIDGATVIGFDWACFTGNRTIASVYIPDGITDIPPGAFNLCVSLADVRISPNTVSIGNGAFEGSGITSIHLPKGLTEVGMRAFYGCKDLKTVIIPSNASFNAEVFADSGIETVVFEDGVKIIGYSMFASTNLTEVILPTSVQAIGVSAFSGCPNLETVLLNQGLTEIGAYAFASNPKLTEIVIPSSVVNMRDNSFVGCQSLKKVKFDGNAPQNYISENTQSDMPAYTVYYHSDAEGFASPKWYVYPTKTW